MSGFFGNQLGVWTSWVPTITAGGGGTPVTVLGSAEYMQSGKIVFGRFDFTVTSNNGATTDIRLTPPVTAATNAGYCGAVEAGITGKLCGGYVTGTTVRLQFYDGTHPSVDGAIFIGTFMYKAA